MIEIVPANEQNIPDIQRVDALAWLSAFREILSPEQIRYMMDMMYGDDALKEQIIEKKHCFVLAKEGCLNAGYMSYELNCEGSGKTKIHKIYLLPDQTKKGIGRLLVEYARREARANGDTAIYLNVNRHNRNAIDFYSKTGFALVKSEIIDIGGGFVMDDFVFELPAGPA